MIIITISVLKYFAMNIHTICRGHDIAWVVEHSPVKVGIIRLGLHGGCICSLGYFQFQWRIVSVTDLSGEETLFIRLLLPQKAPRQ